MQSSIKSLEFSIRIPNLVGRNTYEEIDKFALARMLTAIVVTFRYKMLPIITEAAVPPIPLKGVRAIFYITVIDIAVPYA